MNSTLERVAHIIFRKNESCFAFLVPIGASVKGKYNSLIKKALTMFSYDGYIFHNQADSKNGHYYTTLAKIDEAPLAVGGYDLYTNKAETFDIASNTWTEVASYPYQE